jgi:hypothetical protein
MCEVHDYHTQGAAYGYTPALLLPVAGHRRHHRRGAARPNADRQGQHRPGAPPGSSTRSPGGCTPPAPPTSFTRAWTPAWPPCPPMQAQPLPYLRIARRCGASRIGISAASCTCRVARIWSVPCPRSEPAAGLHYPKRRRGVVGIGAPNARRSCNLFGGDPPDPGVSTMFLPSRRGWVRTGVDPSVVRSSSLQLRADVTGPPRIPADSGPGSRKPLKSQGFHGFESHPCRH